MTINYGEYLELLLPASEQKLEEMAQKARQLTLKHFGKTILLYAPLYLSNECDNNCIYCGFSQRLEEKRITLSVEEAVKEAEILYQKGFRHILLVSGEKKDKVDLKYLKKVISCLHEKFESIGLEIYPMHEEEYRELFLAGADSLTIYQEVYDQRIYQEVHPQGAKADYQFRLATPERAARAGFCKINIGALLGLADWRSEAAALGQHAAYLKKKFWQAQIAVSFPRLQASVSAFKPKYPVSDRQLVQMICALRIYQPTLGLVISTRERQALRDNLISLGITQMSAESATSPGGYSCVVEAEEQFSVADKRSLSQVAEVIGAKGYEPVYKDWEKSLI